MVILLLVNIAQLAGDCGVRPQSLPFSVSNMFCSVYDSAGLVAVLNAGSLLPHWVIGGEVIISFRFVTCEASAFLQQLRVCGWTIVDVGESSGARLILKDAMLFSLVVVNVWTFGPQALDVGSKDWVGGATVSHFDQYVFVTDRANDGLAGKVMVRGLQGLWTYHDIHRHTGLLCPFHSACIVS